MTNMKATHDQLMDMLADSDEDCRTLAAQNKELRAEIERLQAVIDEDNKIS